MDAQEQTRLKKTKKVLKKKDLREDSIGMDAGEQTRRLSAEVLRAVVSGFVLLY